MNLIIIKIESFRKRFGFEFFVYDYNNLRFYDKKIKLEKFDEFATQ